MSKINLQRGKLTVENRKSREKKWICSEVSVNTRRHCCSTRPDLVLIRCCRCTSTAAHALSGRFIYAEPSSDSVALLTAAGSLLSSTKRRAAKMEQLVSQLIRWQLLIGQASDSDSEPRCRVVQGQARNCTAEGSNYRWRNEMLSTTIAEIDGMVYP